jgi:hypothetical protein
MPHRRIRSTIGVQHGALCHSGMHLFLAAGGRGARNVVPGRLW